MVCLEGSVANNAVNRCRGHQHLRWDVPLRVLTLLLNLPAMLTLHLNLLALLTLPKPTAVNLFIVVTGL